MFLKIRFFSILCSLFLFSSVSFAADTIDSSAVVESINNIKAPIISIISAMLGVLAIVVAYRMIRKVIG